MVGGVLKNVGASEIIERALKNQSAFSRKLEHPMVRILPLRTHGPIFSNVVLVCPCNDELAHVRVVL